MEDKSLRNVHFTAFYSVNGIQNLRPTKGRFHRWADDLINEDEKWFSRTVGIVEDLDGNIFKVPIEKIMFSE